MYVQYAGCTCMYNMKYIYTHTFCMNVYTNIHVPTMLAKSIEMVNKQIQQTGSHSDLEIQQSAAWHSKINNGLENKQPQ